MGRVARYKKIKSFDPYSKQNNGRIDYSSIGVWGMGDDGRKVKKISKTVQNIRARRKRPTKSHILDSPIEKDDFDLHDLVGSLKKDIFSKEAISKIETKTGSQVPALRTTTLIDSSSTEETRPSSTLSCVDADDEEIDLVHQLKLDIIPHASSSVVQSPGRMANESKNAYRKRVKTETQKIIKQTRIQQRNPDKRQRKKEFLSNKKRKKKVNTVNRPSDFNGNVGTEFDDNEFWETRVAFGDQVLAPPVFRQLPKGVTSSTNSSDTQGRNSSYRGMNQEVVDEDKDDMDRIREMVQARYAQIKAMKTTKREFHL